MMQHFCLIDNLTMLDNVGPVSASCAEHDPAVTRGEPRRQIHLAHKCAKCKSKLDLLAKEAPQQADFSFCYNKFNSPDSREHNDQFGFDFWRLGIGIGTQAGQLFSPFTTNQKLSTETF